jgi:hypothetical protein
VVSVRDRFGVSERATFAPLNVHSPAFSLETLTSNVSSILATASVTSDTETVLQVSQPSHLVSSLPSSAGDPKTSISTTTLACVALTLLQ